MNSIIGFSKILTENNLEEKERIRYSNNVLNAGNDLLRLLDDIIDIERIEAGQLNVRYSMGCVDKMMNELFETFKNNVKSGVELVHDVDENIENISINTDFVRCKQILTNLIGNAVKFTEKGFVRFGYEWVGKDVLQFYVKDTGIGIHENDVEKIFDRFQRIENDEKIFLGTGLGFDNF